MNRKLIRLTESDLHRIVKESVNQILNENEDDDYGIPPYIVIIDGEMLDDPFDDIDDAIEYAERWDNSFTNACDPRNVIIYDGNEKEVWSAIHWPGLRERPWSIPN